MTRTRITLLSAFLSLSCLLHADDKQAYERIKARADYGKGGAEVLRQAFLGLQERHRDGKAALVELPDLWTQALQEGSVLFDKPDKLWSATPPGETLDMLGQTTVGPWQMTTTNIQLYLGAPYGVKKDWKLRKLVEFCREHPLIQAKMAADIVQWNFESNGGKRSPYGIQSYFWLDGFVKGDIGQGTWDDSVLVLPDPKTGKMDNSPARMKKTGFYAKQILLGWKDQPHGLLYWLWVIEDREGIKSALRAWRDQLPLAWDAKANKALPIPGAKPGRFAIKVADIKYGLDQPDYIRDLKQMAAEVAAEKR